MDVNPMCTLVKPTLDFLGKKDGDVLHDVFV